MIKLSELRVNPNNPRTIKDARFKKLCNSIRDFPKMMAIRPIVIDRQNGNLILGGNMRYNALKALKFTEIPDEWVRDAAELTEDEKRRFIIEDNMPFGEWDFDALANSFDTSDLIEWGFDEKELGVTQEPVDAEPQIDRAEELNKKWQVKTGDLWQIGEHRLLCGDSTKREDVTQVLDGKKVDLNFSDPPYGIKRDKGFEGFGGFGGFGPPIPRRQYKDDWDSERPTKEQFDFMLSIAKQSIFWGGNYFADILPKSTHWIVWDKNNTMPTFGDCELAWTSFDKKSVKKYEITYNGLIGKEEERFHATQKPVLLFKACLSDYTKNDEKIIDFYMGSGTTMVACQNLNRKCRGIEISPPYCAVILERMVTAFPGIEIKRIE